MIGKSTTTEQTIRNLGLLTTSGDGVARGEGPPLGSPQMDLAAAGHHGPHRHGSAPPCGGDAKDVAGTEE